MFRTLFKIVILFISILVGLYLFETCKNPWELRLPSMSESSEFTNKIIEYYIDNKMPTTILVEDKRYYKAVDTTAGTIGVVDYITPEGDTLELVKNILKQFEIKTEDYNPPIKGFVK